jgi:hypothetical protein
MQARTAVENERLHHVTAWLEQRVIGQSALMERLIMALICGATCPWKAPWIGQDARHQELAAVEAISTAFSSHLTSCRHHR